MQMDGVDMKQPAQCRPREKKFGRDRLQTATCAALTRFATRGSLGRSNGGVNRLAKQDDGSAPRHDSSHGSRLRGGRAHPSPFLCCLCILPRLSGFSPTAGGRHDFPTHHEQERRQCSLLFTRWQAKKEAATAIVSHSMLCSGGRVVWVTPAHPEDLVELAGQGMEALFAIHATLCPGILFGLRSIWLA